MLCYKDGVEEDAMRSELVKGELLAASLKLKLDKLKANNHLDIDFSEQRSDLEIGEEIASSLMLQLESIKSQDFADDSDLSDMEEDHSRGSHTPSPRARSPNGEYHACSILDTARSGNMSIINTARSGYSPYPYPPWHLASPEGFATEGFATPAKPISPLLTAQPWSNHMPPPMSQRLPSVHRDCEGNPNSVGASAPASPRTRFFSPIKTVNSCSKKQPQSANSSFSLLDSSTLVGEEISQCLNNTSMASSRIVMVPLVVDKNLERSNLQLREMLDDIHKDKQKRSEWLRKQASDHGLSLLEKERLSYEELTMEMDKRIQQLQSDLENVRGQLQEKTGECEQFKAVATELAELINKEEDEEVFEAQPVQPDPVPDALPLAPEVVPEAEAVWPAPRQREGRRRRRGAWSSAPLHPTCYVVL